MARPSTRGSPAENESGKKESEYQNSRQTSVSPQKIRGAVKARKRKCLAVNFRRIPEEIDVYFLSTDQKA